jgi:hypothetical protein
MRRAMHLIAMLPSRSTLIWVRFGLTNSFADVNLRVLFGTVKNGGVMMRMERNSEIPVE